ncbi:MAG: sulfotransferase [Gammaproteobacteria bacterium]
MEREKVKVLFIGGEGRSGSTLLDLMLGQLDGCFSVGELRFIWVRGLSENQLCGCGEKFKECEFWGNVMEEAFGGIQSLDIKEIQDLWRFVDNFWSIPQLASPWRRASFNEKLTAYAHILGKLYKAISKVSGTRFIIDSSKKPSHAFILNTLPDIELQVIHLIRDSRAVAYSFQKKKLRPEIHWKQEYMPVQRPTHIALSWNLRNTSVNMISCFNKHYTRLRYEDLVRDPQKALSRVFAQLRERMPSLKLLDGSKINPRLNHTVSGNPMRFQRKIVEIRTDTEWQEKMYRRQRVLVTALTWPFLLRYGYLKGN